ncbi:MAG: glycosyltransferase family 4 protein [Bacteroidales bacterium]|nr:glycosyltransferase family 4 protein [Bacteroidales bacterium]
MKNGLNLLYLARVEKEKGIYIALEAFKKLKNNRKDLVFSIAGDGTELKNVIAWVEHENIPDVKILGHLTGNQISDSFLEADIYLFPTFYKEGLPTSVLEAMAFGLPVITRPVAGIKDIFVNGEMGMLIESVSPDDFANAISDLMNNPATMIRIGKYNSQHAKQHYYGPKVAERIESVYESIAKN